MSKQIFKNSPPIDILFTLLNKIAFKNEGYFILNKVAFKKAVYNNLVVEFLELLKPYYHKSKAKYVEKLMNYNAFMTVVRQLCNYHDIVYKSVIKYDKSTYEIVYYISSSTFENPLLKKVEQNHPLLEKVEQNHPLLEKVEQNLPLLKKVEQNHPLLEKVKQNSDTAKD
jgi:hypothetical protein